MPIIHEPHYHQNPGIYLIKYNVFIPINVRNIKYTHIHTLFVVKLEESMLLIFSVLSWWIMLDINYFVQSYTYYILIKYDALFPLLQDMNNISVNHLVL